MGLATLYHYIYVFSSIKGPVVFQYIYIKEVSGSFTMKPFNYCNFYVCKNSRGFIDFNGFVPNLQFSLDNF